MPNELIETAKELKLLGWSEEGTKTYTELFLSEDLNVITLNKFIIILSLAFLLLLIFISTSRYLNSNREEKSLQKDKDCDIKIQSSNTNKKPALKSNNSEETRPTLVENKLAKLKSNKVLKIETIQIKPILKNEGSSNQAINSPPVKKNRKPLKDQLIKLAKETAVDTDRSIESIILIGIIIYELSIELIKISSSFFTRTKSKSMPLNQNRILPIGLFDKDEEELKNILEGIEIVPSLSKNQLIDLIASNPQALKKIALAERKNELTKKTNIELKSLLKGVGNISRLKKKELIEKILLLENKINI